jgi:diacylglycerol kinase family enzyme
LKAKAFPIVVFLPRREKSGRSADSFAEPHRFFAAAAAKLDLHGKESMASKGFHILINIKSGTVLNMGVPAVEAAITASGLEVASLTLSEPSDMQAELERLSRKKEPLLIGGGDGTIRDCAQALSECGKAFGVLPFGTMNLLAQDLELHSLQGALKAYAEGARIEAVDAAYVNGEIFLCCASIGTMPHASQVREEAREAHDLLLVPKLFFYVLNNLDRHKRQRVVLDIDGQMEKLHTAAVVIANNRFADSIKLTESNFKRKSLKDGELAAYAPTTKTRTSHLRLLSRLVLGHWLKDPDMKEIVGHKMKLWTRRKKELVSIDGEVIKMNTPLEFTLKPKSIRLLVPASPPQKT